MENKNMASEHEESVQETQSKLHTVTPLSKYLAMLLFVVMPFLGGWIGYTYAPEKVVEVEKVVIVEQSDAIKAPDNTANNIQNVIVNNNFLKFTDTDYGFSFNYPKEWKAQVIDQDYGLYLPPDGLKHILVTKGEREQGLIVTLVETDALSDFFGCFEYKYNDTLENWERQNETETDRCIDETNIKSRENQTLEANYVAAETQSLKTSDSNPTNVLIPLSKELSFNVTYTNWQGESGLGEVPSEAKAIIDSLQLVNE